MIITQDDYLKFKLSLSFASGNQDSLKNYLDDLSDFGNNAFASLIVRMKIKDKINFIVALITLDSQKFSHACSPSFDNHFADAVLSIIQVEPTSDQCWFTQTQKELLQLSFLRQVDNNVSVDILEAIDLLNVALAQIPDTFFSIGAKKQLFEEIGGKILNIDKTILSKLKILCAYNELPPLLATNKYNGSITPDQYLAAINCGGLDFSSFFFLTLGVLQPYKILSTADLKQLHNYYLENNYKAIQTQFHVLTGGASIPECLSKAIDKYLSQFSGSEPKAQLHKSDIRRFYENRLAQLYLGAFFLDNIEIIDRLSTFYLNSRVTDIAEFECSMHRLANLKNTDMINKMVDYKAKSASFALRGREYKSMMMPKEAEFVGHNQLTAGGARLNAIYSRNPGTLTSISPNFYDELTVHTMRNRCMDSVQFMPNDQVSYLALRARSPLVASLSGHAYFFIALLNDYAEKNKNSPSIAQDINKAALVFIYYYVSKGYHSLYEMLDVFYEEAIIKDFDHFHISFELSLEASLLQKAALDTQEYVRTVQLKRVTNSQIFDHYRFFMRGNPSLNKVLIQEISSLTQNEMPGAIVLFECLKMLTDDELFGHGFAINHLEKCLTLFIAAGTISEKRETQDEQNSVMDAVCKLLSKCYSPTVRPCNKIVLHTVKKLDTKVEPAVVTPVKTSKKKAYKRNIGKVEVETKQEKEEAGEEQRKRTRFRTS